MPAAPRRAGAENMGPSAVCAACRTSAECGVCFCHLRSVAGLNARRAAAPQAQNMTQCPLLGPAERERLLMQELKAKDVLTTGEVARICNVAPRTVSKWFDSGALHGYRIPGSKDRRIPLNQLIRFMKHHGMPLNGLMTGSSRILIVDDEQDIVEVLEKILEDEAKYEVEVAK